MLKGLMLVCCACLPAAASAQELTVAAASDLTFVLPELASRFEKETGRRVKLVFGSSGNFFSQIQNGAPYDLFFSADADYPEKLAAAGLAEPGTLWVYATGKLVLWVPRTSPIDLARGLAVVLDPAVKRIAIANPRHAPYGRAAVAALQRKNVYEAMQGKLVFGENVSQAAGFVASGNADIGVLPLSLALAPALKDKGRYFEIPPDDYPPIRQAVVLLASSPNKPAARQFLDYLRKPASVALLVSYGFTAPRDALPAPPREKKTGK